MSGEYAGPTNGLGLIVLGDAYSNIDAPVGVKGRQLSSAIRQGSMNAIAQYVMLTRH